MEINNIDNLKHILQSGRLNFLIGSGISCPYFETLGDIELRLGELEQKADTDSTNIVRSSIIKEYFEKCISKNYAILNNDIDECGKTVLQNYQRFLNNINKIILLRKSNILSKQTNLFTTNVDIFLEKSMEEEKIEFNDGFMGRLDPYFELSNFKKSLYKTSPHYDVKFEIPIFNIFKLHGSVSWKLNQYNKIKLDNKLDNIKEMKKILHEIPKECFIKIINDDHNQIKTIDELLLEAEKLNLKDKEKGLLNELKKCYEKIPMINPTKEKFKFTTLNYTYYELLRMFSNELERENSILFVMGFSFADEHIREILLRSINSNPTLSVFVFVFDNKAKELIRNHLGFSETTPKNNNLKLIYNDVV